VIEAYLGSEDEDEAEAEAEAATEVREPAEETERDGAA
jgi:hypothetical protein